METHSPDLTQVVFELDKRTAVFQARCEQQWVESNRFHTETRSDLKDLKALVNAMRIKRAADTAVVSLFTTGAGLIALELIKKLLA